MGRVRSGCHVHCDVRQEEVHSCFVICLISGNPTNQGPSSPPRPFAPSWMMKKRNLAFSSTEPGSGASSSQFFGFMTSRNHQTYIVHRVLPNFRDLNGLSLKSTVRPTEMDRGINTSLRSSWIFVCRF